MDTLGALALATEPPKEELMSLPPVGRRVPFVTAIMWRNIFGQALFQLVVLAILGTGGEYIFLLSGPQAAGVKRTLIFNTFVFCQVGGGAEARGRLGCGMRCSSWCLRDSSRSEIGCFPRRVALRAHTVP